jgi:serine/threonine protein kinase
MGMVVNTVPRTASTQSLESSDCDLDYGGSVPTRVGRYEVGEALGTGAMGVVHRAHDPELGRTVAIKLLRTRKASAVSAGRLLREAQSMARLSHPNVVSIYDVGPADGAVFIAMELLEGGTLRSWLRGGPHAFDDILDRFIAAGQGLAAAHRAGLVHRDFKPDNVLLGADGEVHVADFGLARLAADSDASEPLRTRPNGVDDLTRTGDVLGTPAYMAPEQLCGEPSDARADQFSFCVALWEGLYGVRPFSNPPAGIANPLQARYEAIAAGPAAAPVDRARPVWIGRLLARGLALDPAQRWPTMQALLDAIAVGRRGHPWRLPAASLVVVVLAASAGIAWLRGARPSPPPPPPPPPPRTDLQVPVAGSELAPITQRRDLKAAAISPDGTTLAIVVHRSLVLRALSPDGAERVLIKDGVNELHETPSWSPDGSRLLIGMISELPGTRRIALVDVRRGTWSRLPILGVATFLSDTEVAVTAPRERLISVVRTGEWTVRTRLCKVTGEYSFLASVIGAPDGSMTALIENGDSRSLVFLDPQCRERARFAEPGLHGGAASDHRTVVALVHHDQRSELIELDAQGNLASRREIAGEVADLIGRRRGVDYVLALAPQSRLDRVDGTARIDALARVTLYSRSGWTTFALAPGGDALAWIELNGFPRSRGTLRVAALPRGVELLGNALAGALASPIAAPIENAVTTAWSPDGERLATVIDDSDGPRIEVSDRAGRDRQRLPLGLIDRTAHPVWLGNHRVAAQTRDRLSFRWIDLITREQGDLVDRHHGSTYSLVQSPRDGTLAMWRLGAPGAIDAQTEHLWLVRPGGRPEPLHLHPATKQSLVPSWSNDGELWVRAIESGWVSRVAIETGELTPIVQLAAMPVDIVHDEHLLPLSDGSWLSPETDPGLYVATVPAEPTTAL